MTFVTKIAGALSVKMKLGYNRIWCGFVFRERIPTRSTHLLNT